jgi:hypothetical protein
MVRRSGYFSSTLHPWPCLLFLLPLLIAYEAGIVWLGGAHPEALRNGADTWLRWGLQASGMPSLYVAPGLIVGVFLVWSWLRSYDRPENVGLVCSGMACESALLAMGLLKASQLLRPLLEAYDIRLAIGLDENAIRQMVTFVGAGIYEEVVFRLLLFFALGCLLRIIFMPVLLVLIIRITVSALVFAAAHHIGPYGEKFDTFVFLFRALAGLYFGMIYQVRGFGVAVGTHAAYDVLVGVLLANPIK